MNREIKFEIKLKAKEPVNGFNEGDCVTIFNDIFDRQNGIAFYPIDKKFEIVYQRQFTGLLDKNGKEVFEGDIFKCKCSKSGSEKVEMYTCTIDWNSKRYNVVIHHKGQKWATGITYWSEIEVIGNIYETPELLG